MVKYCEVRYGHILLGNKIRYCDNLFTRMKGLMFNFSKDGAILVSRGENVSESSIHMFFVFRSLDILWLNKNMEVVDIRRNVKPFTPLVKPKKAAKYVVELPVGEVEKVHKGARLDFGRIRKR